MSHRTGIKSNAELLKFFAKCRGGKTRLIKITIENEELTLAAHKELKKDWQRDFDSLVAPLIEADSPCYILYRLDEKADEGYNWILISWIPETSSIRQKMIYASTKSTLKQEFFSKSLKEYHATSIDEMTLSGYLRNQEVMDAPRPLTQREKEIIEMRKTEVRTNVGVDTKHQTMSGIKCVITEASLQAINDMKRGAYNYLQFSIDLGKEEIYIANADNIDVNQLSSKVPSQNASFILFLFKHSYDGDYQESYIFIYSMPGYSISVKERMMYSSCKAPFLDTITSGTMGIDIAKKLEINDASEELSEENLLEELHPKKMLHKTKFDKPTPPSKRGPRRIIK